MPSAAQIPSWREEKKTKLNKKNLPQCLHTKVILQAGGANGRSLVLRTLQVCASIPGQQGGACAEHSHLGRGSGGLTFHLGGRRLGGLAESLLKAAGGNGEKGGEEGGETRRRTDGSQVRGEAGGMRWLVIVEVCSSGSRCWTSGVCF